LLPCASIGISVCALLHGTYNTFSGQVLNGFFGMVVACVSVILLMAYVMQVHESARQSPKPRAGT
jgi:uncharacterized membrane protein